MNQLIELIDIVLIAFGWIFFTVAVARAVYLEGARDASAGARQLNEIAKSLSSLDGKGVLDKLP
jgi:hypothetical protein